MLRLIRAVCKRAVARLPCWGPRLSGCIRVITGSCRLRCRSRLAGLEQAPGAPGLKGAFAQRNRLLVALAQAVVLVECPRRSGALQAAEIAWSLQRPIWVVPADSDRESAAGSNGWLNQGATALLDPAQLVEALGPGPLQTLVLPQPPDPSPLLSALGSGASFEELQLRLQLSPGALAKQLLAHEQQGSIEALPGLCWRPRHTEIDLPVALQP